VQLRDNEPLQSYNSLALQGRARALLRLQDASQLVPALEWAAGEKLPVITLGEGSNVVIAGDLEALVLRIDTRGPHVVEEAAG
jgi:UDP-N-acetylmuramate dehydrogenase